MSRILQNVSEVLAPTSDYPAGRIKNKNAAAIPPVIGTPIVEEIYGDIIQFLQKLMIQNGITPNDLPDNETNGYQTIEALVAEIQSNIDIKTFRISGSEMMLNKIAGVNDAGMGANLPVTTDSDGKLVSLDFPAFLALIGVYSQWQCDANFSRPIDIGDNAANFGVTNDGSQHDLDLSSIVPAGKLVSIFASFVSTIGNKGTLIIRKKGDTLRYYNYEASATSGTFTGAVQCFVDSASKISYRFVDVASVQYFQVITYI